MATSIDGSLKLNTKPKVGDIFKLDHYTRIVLEADAYGATILDIDNSDRGNDSYVTKSWTYNAWSDLWELVGNIS